MFEYLITIAAFVGCSTSVIARETFDDPQDLPFNPKRFERGIVDDEDAVISSSNSHSSDNTRTSFITLTQAETLELFLLFIILILFIVYLLFLRYQPRHVRPVQRLLHFLIQISRFRLIYNTILHARGSPPVDEEITDLPPSVVIVQEIRSDQEDSDDASSASYNTAEDVEQEYEHRTTVVQIQTLRMQDYTLNSSHEIAIEDFDERNLMSPSEDAEVSSLLGRNIEQATSPANEHPLARDVEIEARR